MFTFKQAAHERKRDEILLFLVALALVRLPYGRLTSRGVVRSFVAVRGGDLLRRPTGFTTDEDFDWVTHGRKRNEILLFLVV